MMAQRNDNDNVLLNRITNKYGFRIEELIPGIEKTEEDVFLCWDASGNIRWKPVPAFVTNYPTVTPESHGIYFDAHRIGIGRNPLHTYKVDLGVPENTKMTAFHIGDGLAGFSMGNGTYEGFVPEIVGMGKTEHDAGLYFLGKTSSTLPSSVPLVIIDGRNGDNTPLTNRPIFGITNGDYFNYKLIVDTIGRVGIGKIPRIYKLEIEGTLCAEDVITDSSVSLNSLKEEVDNLKIQIQLLIKNNQNGC